MANQEKQKKQGLLGAVTELIGLLFIVFLVRTIGFGLYQVPTGSMETTMLVGERFFADKFTYLWRAPKKGEVIAFNDPRFPYSKDKLKKLWQQYVWGPSNWTKRVIGIPGDHVRGAVENGKPVVYVNGEKLNEPYLNQYPLIYTSNYIWRSYDPNYSFANQPFYQIVPFGAGDLASLPLKYAAEPIEGTGTKGSVVGDRFWNGTDEFSVKLKDDEYWVMGDNRRGSSDSRFIGPLKQSFIHGRILFRIWSIDSDYQWWIADLLSHPLDFWKRVRWNRFFQWVY